VSQPRWAEITAKKAVKERQMVAGMSRDELVSALVRIGEKEMTGDGQAEIDAYFAPTSSSTDPTEASGTTRVSRPISRRSAAHSMT
jgi:hypothetical protein